jgi:hypothetical protein
MELDDKSITGNISITGATLKSENFGLYIPFMPYFGAGASFQVSSHMGTVPLKTRSFCPECASHVLPSFVATEHILSLEPQNNIQYVNIAKQITFNSTIDFLSNFYQCYFIRNYNEILDFLKSNEELVELLESTIQELKNYYGGSIESIYLEFKNDPENEPEYNVLFLQIKSTLSLHESLDRLEEFQIKWLIPKYGARLNQFNIDIV